MTTTKQRSASRAVCFCQRLHQKTSFPSGDDVRERNDRTCQTFFSFEQSYKNWLHKHSCMYLACTRCGLLAVLAVHHYNLLPVCSAVAPCQASVASRAQAHRACSSANFGGSYATHDIHWYLLWSKIHGTARRDRATHHFKALASVDQA